MKRLTLKDKKKIVDELSDDDLKTILFSQIKFKDIENFIKKL